MHDFKRRTIEFSENGGFNGEAVSYEFEK